MKSGFYTILIFSLCFDVCVIKAQDATQDSLENLYPYTYFQTEALLDLGTDWLMGEETCEVPFVSKEGNPMVLFHSFELPCIPDDSVFLYFEGVAWRAEVELNGSYLGVHDDPFAVWEIAIAHQWLRQGINHLKVKLSTGYKRDLYPQQFIGIFRPVYLLLREQRAGFNLSPLAQTQSGDTIGVVAPYYRRTSYVFDSLEAARTVWPLYNAGIRQVYFPYQPDRKMKAFCAQLGFKEVKIPGPEAYLAWANFYAFEASSLNYSPQFWLDEEGNRTQYFGSYFRWGEVTALPPIENSNRFWLALMIFFPLIGMAVVKLLSPVWVSSAGSLLSRPRLYLDNLYDTTNSNPGLLFFLVSFRILLWTVLLTMVFYYIQRSNQWEVLNIVKDWSLLNYLFYGDDSLGRLFLKSLLLIGGLFLLEQFMNRMVSLIFKVKGFATGMLNLNTIGSYPTVWLLPLPMAFMLFVEGTGQQLILPILLALLLFYVLRGAYLVFLGLEKLFSFSSGIKFLYICAFNILPYIIWF